MTRMLERIRAGNQVANTQAREQVTQAREQVDTIIRGKEWLNLSVRAKDSDLTLGKVKDFLLDFSGGLVRGILLDWPADDEGQVVPLHAVSGVGRTTLWVNSASHQTWTRLWPQLHALYTNPLKLGNIALYDQQGQQLGRIEDVYFRRNSATIVGYAVNQGSWDDIFPEVLFLRAEDMVGFSEHGAIANRDAAKDLECWARAGHTSAEYVQLKPSRPKVIHPGGEEEGPGAHEREYLKRFGSLGAVGD